MDDQNTAGAGTPRLEQRPSATRTRDPRGRWKLVAVLCSGVLACQPGQEPTGLPDGGEIESDGGIEEPQEWACEGHPAGNAPEHDYYFWSNCWGDDCSHVGCRIEGYLARELEGVNEYCCAENGEGLGWERNLYSAQTAWLKLEGTSSWSSSVPDYRTSHHNITDSWTAEFSTGIAIFSYRDTDEWVEPVVEVTSHADEQVLPPTVVRTRRIDAGLP